MTSVENESSEIPELIEIPEQNLHLINEVKPYFNKNEDLYVVIAREINYRYGKNNGDLRVGILRQTNSDLELVLPFSRKVIYANIKSNTIDIAYVENMTLQTTTISFNAEGKLDFEDYAFLLEPEEQYNLNPSNILR